MLNQCTQWHFPERIGEEMRWWVCPSPTNRRVWFPRHPSYTGFVAFQSCAYLKVVPICALNVLRLGFQHTSSKSNILRLYLWERWSPFGSLTSSSPRSRFFCYSTHIMESIDNSFEFISIILSQVFHVNLSQFFSHLYRLSPNGITDLHRQWMGGLGVWKKLSNSESCHR